MEIEVERQPTLLLIRVTGDLRLWNHPDAEQKLLATFRSGLDDPPPQVVLSLTRVTAVDSRGIAVLVQMPVKCSQRDIGFKVVMPAGVPGQALRRVGIFALWPQFEEESAARQAAA